MGQQQIRSSRLHLFLRKGKKNAADRDVVDAAILGEIAANQVIAANPVITANPDTTAANPVIAANLAVAADPAAATNPGVATNPTANDLAETARTWILPVTANLQ